MRKWLGRVAVLTTALLLVVFLLSGGTVLAATTATVTVNATPAYVQINVSPTTYGFGAVEVSTNYSSAQDAFTIGNGSSINIDIAISCNATWAGGNDWTHSDAGTPGSTTAALYADPDAGTWHIIVKNATPNDIYTNTGTASLPFGLRLRAPTVFDDAVLKTNTVTLTASAS